jgi:pimeloyl-ACP methyl ester carboxylesterase
MEKKEITIQLRGHSFYTKQYIFDKTNENPTIVFLHDALGSVAQWRDFPEKIVEVTGFNCLTYDRLGHGKSDNVISKRDINYLHHEAWDVLPSFIEHFNIKKPILFGHSDGGTIALLYAARFKTEKIITEAAHVLVENVTLEGIKQALTNKDFLISRLEQYHGKKTVELFNAWTKTWLDPSFKNWNIEKLLKNISCPTLIIQGENDEYATIEHVNRIIENIGKNTAALIIPNCGHTPHREAENIVLDAVVSFLKT